MQFFIYYKFQKKTICSQGNFLIVFLIFKMLMPIFVVFLELSATLANKLTSSPTFLAMFTVLLVIHETEAHFRIPLKHEMGHNVRIGPAHTIKRQGLEQKLRFEIVYDDSIEKLNSANKKLVTKKLIPEAIDYFHNTLSVRRSVYEIRLQRTCKDNAYFLKDEQGKNLGDMQFCKLECVQTKCGPVTVPQKHLDECRICDTKGVQCLPMPGDEWSKGKGVAEKDFILYVSALQTTHCDVANAVAYASYCQQEQVHDRPVAGFANLCPDRLDPDPRHYSNLISTVKHEIYHALGFSAGLYAFYRDQNGEPYTPRGKHGLPAYNEKYNLYQWSPRVVTKIVRKKWAVKKGRIDHVVQMIVTPRVRDAVRDHFNCDTLEGAEIENQGGVGTEFTHWEKRLFENEAMTGTYTQNPVFSRLTLALMEDTGWYRANYSMAEDLDWGRNKGCKFAMSSCKTWMEDHMDDDQSAQPFCFTVKQTPLRMRCTHSRMSLALCNLRQYEKPLPQEYQYFSYLPDIKEASGGHKRTVHKDTATYGGAVALADYCPYYQKFTLTGNDGKRRETTCTSRDNAPSDSDNYALESYGKDCKCFQQGRPWAAKKGLLTRTMLDWGSGCYNYFCDNGLNIRILNNTYKCHHAGQHLNVSGYLGEWKIAGSLVCPHCWDFCGDSTGCPVAVKTKEDSLKKSQTNTGTSVNVVIKCQEGLVVRLLVTITMILYLI